MGLYNMKMINRSVVSREFVVISDFSLEALKTSMTKISSVKSKTLLHFVRESLQLFT